MENLWQASKVEPKWVEGRKQPPEEWWKRRDRIWTDPKAHRHVIPKNERVAAGFRPQCFWNGKYIDWVDARKEVYIPLYVKYVQKTEAWKRLMQLFNEGANIQILGYDGRSEVRGGDAFSLFDEFNDTSQPFGHEMVLMCMLRGQKVWEWKVVDCVVVDSRGFRVVDLE